MIDQSTEVSFTGSHHIDWRNGVFQLSLWKSLGKNCPGGKYSSYSQPLCNKLHRRSAHLYDWVHLTDTKAYTGKMGPKFGSYTQTFSKGCDFLQRSQEAASA